MFLARFRLSACWLQVFKIFELVISFLEVENYTSSSCNLLFTISSSTWNLRLWMYSTILYICQTAFILYSTSSIISCFHIIIHSFWNWVDFYLMVTSTIFPEFVIEYISCFVINRFSAFPLVTLRAFRLTQWFFYTFTLLICTGLFKSLFLVIIFSNVSNVFNALLSTSLYISIIMALPR